MFPPLVAAGMRGPRPSSVLVRAEAAVGSADTGTGSTREGGTPSHLPQWPGLLGPLRSPFPAAGPPLRPGRPLRPGPPVRPDFPLRPSPPVSPSGRVSPQAECPLRSGATPLRVVLVEVGEQQMAAAGVAALTGQVHGGTTLATPVRRGGREGKHLQRAAHLNPGGPSPHRAPAASSSPPAPCLRCGQRSGPAPARPAPSYRPPYRHRACARPRDRWGRACARAVAPKLGRKGGTGGGALKLSRACRGRRLDGRLEVQATAANSVTSPLSSALTAAATSLSRSLLAVSRSPLAGASAVLLCTTGGLQGSADGTAGDTRHRLF